MFFFAHFFAQLDREHWFAPIYDGQENTNQRQQYLSLSTDEPNDTTVKVYNNNVLIYEIRDLKKGSPKSIGIDRNYIITSNLTNLASVGSLGLHVVADNPIYANLRIAVENHAEIITSKGSSALGKEFYTVVSPNNVAASSLNFMTSIIATKDNTKVTINDFKKSLKYLNTTQSSNFTVTLNKGQSYILAGRTNDNTGNLDAFTGAHITANNPITVTNGNFNGQQSSLMAAGTTVKSDILMDQSVPVNFLGDQFVVVKGFGKIGNDMEGAIVVATEPNTSIFVNGSTTPIVVLNNPGDHYWIRETNFQENTPGHFNMLINTDKNFTTNSQKKIYVYQLMAGVENGDNALATGGMNFIPPVSCYLPKKIDEIGDINKIGLTFYHTKLNIVTQSGAEVTVKKNGAVLQVIQASDLVSVGGTSEWKSFSIDNISGTISLESTKAMTAGISAGDNNVGYGGYFAGFSKIPLIVNKGGNCIPTAILTLPEGFDDYKWYNKDNPTVVLSTSNTFQPSVAGIYYAVVKQGTCDAAQTQDFYFYECTTYTGDIINICDAQNIPTITAKFVLGTEAPASIKITKDCNPSFGSLSINGLQISYTPKPNVSNVVDSFEYQVYNAAGTYYEEFHVTVNNNQIAAKDATVGQCSTTNPTSFDLTETNYTTEPHFQSVKYYTSPTGAENQTATEEIPMPYTSYTALGGTIVYARIENTLGCHVVRKVTLKILSTPDVRPENYTKPHCDEDDGKLDGNYQADLEEVTNSILADKAGFTINYFKTQPDANSPTASNTLPKNIPYIFTAANNKIWVRVESGSSCPVVMKEIELKIGNLIPDATGGSASLADNACNDVTAFDYVSKFTNETGLSATYYKSLPDAQNNTNGTTVNNPTMLSIVDGLNTFYFRVWNAASCARIFKLELTRQSPPTPTFPDAPYHICDDGTSTYNLTAGLGSGYTYEWYNDNTSTFVGSGESITVLPGKYFVIVKSASLPCTTKSTVVEVVGEPKPILNTAAFIETFCDDHLDGTYNVKFSTQVTPVILQNSTKFTTQYYRDAVMMDEILTDDWSFTTNTRVWVKVTSLYCGSVSGYIDFKTRQKVHLDNDVATATECGDLDGKYTVTNLDNYRSNFTTDPSLNITYHNSKSGAQNSNDIVNTADLTFINTKTYYLRISSSTGPCPVLAELTININRPEASTELKGVSICAGTTVELKVGTTLDGSDFKSQVWYKAEDLNTAISTDKTYNASIGNYVVVLEAQNGCKHSQSVKVSQAESAKITAIIIDGTTVTVKAEGGVPPYEYSLDGPMYYRPFSTNNVFTDVSIPGIYNVLVKTSSNCEPTLAHFTIIKILNTITPNGDGQNDYIDYSDLKSKANAKFIVIDRYGKKVYDSAERKDYIWDGKLNGKPLPTDTYWYILEWTDLGASAPTQQKGWILLKNN